MITSKNIHVGIRIGIITLVSSMIAFSCLAADDSTIKGSLRENIQSSMKEYIEHQSISGSIYVYDAVDGKLLKLKLDKLHEGIVKKGAFYVSCADFKDQNGRKIDIDFMVREKDDKLITTQALVHSVEGEKRKYHLESK